MVMGTFVPGRRRSGLTFVLPYISSEGRRLPSSETMRSVGACWLWASAAEAVKATARTAAINLRICLLQIRESCGEFVTRAWRGVVSSGTLGGSGAAPVTTKGSLDSPPAFVNFKKTDDLLSAGAPAHDVFDARGAGKVDSNLEGWREIFSTRGNRTASG